MDWWSLLYFAVSYSRFACWNIGLFTGPHRLLNKGERQSAHSSRFFTLVCILKPSDELERVAIADWSTLAMDGVPIDSYVTKWIWKTKPFPSSDFFWPEKLLTTLNRGLQVVSFLSFALPWELRRKDDTQAYHHT